MKTFKLHLIRHGMTAGNLQGLYIGSGTDIPLCDEGRAQLNELKERFEYPQVDTVFSSPLLRAVETANILFPDAKHTFTVHDLREAGFGKFENKPVKELVHDEDYNAAKQAIIDEYCNVDMRLYNDFFDSITQGTIMLRSEEPVFAQQLYRELTAVIQRVITREGADVRKALQKAQDSFQEYLDDEINDY